MQWQDIENDREKYAAYLCSREWAERKEAVRKRCNGVCEKCNARPMYACHHLTYIRKYNEPLSDLQGLCDECHEFTHGKSDVQIGTRKAYPDIRKQEDQTEGAIHCPVCGCCCTWIDSVEEGKNEGAERLVLIYCTCENNHTFRTTFRSACNFEGMQTLVTTIYSIP